MERRPDVSIVEQIIDQRRTDASMLPSEDAIAARLLRIRLVEFIRQQVKFPSDGFTFPIGLDCHIPSEVGPVDVSIDWGETDKDFYVDLDDITKFSIGVVDLDEVLILNGDNPRVESRRRVQNNLGVSEPFSEKRPNKEVLIQYEGLLGDLSKPGVEFTVQEYERVGGA